MPSATTQTAANVLQPESQQVGQVETLKGDATVIRVDGTQKALSVGSPIYEGDRIETAGDGNVGMVFLDGSKFSLAENGEMRVDALVYNPGAGSGTAMFNVTEGFFAFVSGEIAKSADDAMTVETPVATIGIRGTTVVGKAGPEGSDNSVTLLPDADGHLGEIAITNNGGSVIVTEAYQSVSIAGNSQAPSEPQRLDPSDAQRIYGDFYKSYTPANYDSSAQQKDANNDLAEPEIELPAGNEDDNNEASGAAIGKEALLLGKPADGEQVEIEIEAGQQVKFGFDIADAEIAQGDASMILTFADGSVIKLFWTNSDQFAEMPPVFLTADGQLVQLGGMVQYAMDATDPEKLEEIETAAGSSSEADDIQNAFNSHGHGLSNDTQHFGDRNDGETVTGTPFEVSVAEFAGLGGLSPDSAFGAYQSTPEEPNNNAQNATNPGAGTQPPPGSEPEPEEDDGESGEEQQAGTDEGETAIEIEPQPEPEPVVTEPDPEPEPQPIPVVVMPEPEPEPEPDPEPEPEPDPEPVVIEPDPEPEPQPIPVVVMPEPEPEPVVIEPDPEPEPQPIPVVVTPEPEPEPEPEPVVIEPDPEPEPQPIPVVVTPEPEPEPEPEPVVIEPDPEPEPEPEPVPVVVMPEPQPEPEPEPDPEVIEPEPIVIESPIDDEHHAYDELLDGTITIAPFIGDDEPDFSECDRHENGHWHHHQHSWGGWHWRHDHGDNHDHGHWFSRWRNWDENSELENWFNRLREHLDFDGDGHVNWTGRWQGRDENDGERSNSNCSEDHEHGHRRHHHHHDQGDQGEDHDHGHWFSRWRDRDDDDRGRGHRNEHDDDDGHSHWFFRWRGDNSDDDRGHWFSRRHDHEDHENGHRWSRRHDHRDQDDCDENELAYVEVTADTEVVDLLDIVDISDDMRGSLEQLLDNLGSGDEESVTVGHLVEADSSGDQAQTQLIHGFVDAVMAQQVEPEHAVC